MDKRNIFQIIWAALTNGNIQGYLTGTIYQGNLKTMCLPGLNCYSCLGAFGSCPIGAMQAVLNKGKLSFYVTGFLLFIGGIMGRLVCGWLCPFGLVQDLLHKIPLPLKIRYMPAEKYLVKVKYVILVIFVLILPLYMIDDFGNGDPYFCKFICPVGILEGGIPLSISNSAIRQAIGMLFAWKTVILISTIVASIIVYRPFCKVICPLGAIYSFFNKVSLFKYRVDEHKCVSCGKCSKVCLMNVEPTKEANALECIRCGKCKTSCPTAAIESRYYGGIAAKGMAVTKESQN